MYLIQSVETKYISNIHEYASQSYTLKNKNNMHVWDKNWNNTKRNIHSLCIFELASSSPL